MSNAPLFLPLSRRSDSTWGRVLDLQHHLETNGQMYTCPTKAACIAGIKCAFMWDLRTYPKAPSAMHAFMNCSSGWIVRNTIFAGNEDSRSQRAASIPFKTGIVMSDTMTSGQRRRASDTNVAPSVAVPTMSNWRFKSAVVALSKAGWSSASSTRGRIKVSLPSE